MASGVAAVWVPVADMDRAVAFYRDALGLEIRCSRTTGARSTPAA